MKGLFILSTIYIVLLTSLPATLRAQENVTIEGLPGQTSTKYQEVRPVISDNGNTLYLTRRFHPDNIKGEKDFQDIWVSKWDSRGLWMAPKNMGEPFNNKKGNDLIRESISGDSLVLLNTGYKKTDSEIVLYNKRTKEFSDLPIDGFLNKSPYVDFDYNFKHNVIVMAVDRSGSLGDQDLFYSIYNPGTKTFTTPQSMGKVINSEKADFAPFLTIDGNTIFFSSYNNSRGGADIFMSHRLGAWDDWSEPVSLGNEINSSNEETYSSIDPSLQYLYYDSYPSGARNRDIWRATLSDEIKQAILDAKERRKPDPEPVVQEETTEITTPEPVLAQTEEEEEVNSSETEQEVVVATTEPEKEVTLLAEASGQSTLAANTGGSTKPDISEENGQKEVAVKPDPVRINKEISSTKKAPQPKSVKKKPVETKPITLINKKERGQKVNQNIYFAFDSDVVKTEYTDIYQQVVSKMKQENGLTLLLVGHADAIGGENVNLNLSCARAKNVKQKMVASGIAESRIKISCEGEKEPLASNDDEVMGRELNRRVEIYMQ